MTAKRLVNLSACSDATVVIMQQVFTLHTSLCDSWSSPRYYNCLQSYFTDHSFAEVCPRHKLRPGDRVYGIT